MAWPWRTMYRIFDDGVDDDFVERPVDIATVDVDVDCIVVAAVAAEEETEGILRAPTINNNLPDIQ